MDEPVPKNFDMVLKGGTVIDHSGSGVRDIGIEAGKIAEIGDLFHAGAGETIDAAGLHILPGVIDTQVHFREPGATHKDAREPVPRAAARGGVTGFFEMPNPNPPPTRAAALADKIARAK